MAKKSVEQKTKKSSASAQVRSQKPSLVKSTNPTSGTRQKRQENDLPEISTSKSGCVPKLFMLLLPFIAIGAYIFLRS